MSPVISALILAQKWHLGSICWLHLSILPLSFLLSTLSFFDPTQSFFPPPSLAHITLPYASYGVFRSLSSFSLLAEGPCLPQ